MSDSAPRGVSDSAPRGVKPHTIVKLSIALLSINFALCFGSVFSTFMPNDRACYVAIVYALACACFQVYAIRNARTRESEFKVLQTRGMRKLFEKGPTYLAIAQATFAFIAFSVSGANLYTMAAGKSADVTHVVHWSEWKRGTSRYGARCFKHVLVGLSAFENKFGSLCLEVGYGAGTRFHYRGKVSSLGLHVDDMTIEPKGEIRRRSRD